MGFLGSRSARQGTARPCPHPRPPLPATSFYFSLVEPGPSLALCAHSCSVAGVSKPWYIFVTRIRKGGRGNEKEKRA